MAKQVYVGLDERDLAREGLGPTPAPWEDGLRADTGPGFFEWWYFDAHLDDGSTAVIVFLTKPLIQRGDPLTPTVQIVITRPDGVRLAATPMYPPDRFSASRDGCDVRIGPSWVRGDLRRYEMHAEAGATTSTPGLAADLVFTGRVPPWRPGAGMNYYDEACTRFFAWLPSIPFGDVTGTLTYGGQTHEVRGTGYHDHNWGNVDLNRVFSHWYWGRAHVGDFTTIFVQMTATQEFGNQKLPVFMLAQGDRILLDDARPLTLTLSLPRAHGDGKTYPQRLEFGWQGPEGTVSLTVTEPRLIEAMSLLVTLPTWKRMLARLVTNPYYFRFNAQLDLVVNLKDVQATERGSALYELMILH